MILYENTMSLEVFMQLVVQQLIKKAEITRNETERAKDLNTEKERRQDRKKKGNRYRNKDKVKDGLNK
jgi:hypothetical protein